MMDQIPELRMVAKTQVLRTVDLTPVLKMVPNRIKIPTFLLHLAQKQNPLYLLRVHQTVVLLKVEIFS
jgi:hypothetical protein